MLFAKGSGILSSANVIFDFDKVYFGHAFISYVFSTI